MKKSLLSLAALAAAASCGEPVRARTHDTAAAPSASLGDIMQFMRAGLLGRIVLAQAQGTIAAPVATFTGAAAGLFAAPLPLTLGAGLINPNSTFCIDAIVQKVGANATASLDARLGTLNTIADSSIVSVPISITTLSLVALSGRARFGTLLDRFFTQQAQQANGASAVTGLDQTSNVNTQAAMFLNLAISAASAADSFKLIGYTAWVEQ